MCVCGGGDTIARLKRMGGGGIARKRKWVVGVPLLDSRGKCVVGEGYHSQEEERVGGGP